MAGLVSLWTASAFQTFMPNSGRPASAKVGTSGACGRRLSPVTASAVTEPAACRGRSVAVWSMTPSTKPPIRSWIAGGLFLLWKATKEIHHTVDPAPTGDVLDTKNVVISNFSAAIVQILLLDLVFSVDSILTAVGMTEHVPVMVIAVVIAVLVMLLAADPLANFIHENPTVVMLALGFLLMIGSVLIADGFGVHVPKGYIYAAMAFSALVEGLNMLSRRRKSSADPKSLH
eukprot:gene14992-19848_t